MKNIYRDIDHSSAYGAINVNPTLTIKPGSENYVCTVVEITNLHPIEGADRIQRTVVLNNNVVVGKDVKIGDKMLYFCSGTKLNEQYCSENCLYDKPEMNADTTKKGFINSKARVRAIKLKGIISDGMLMPLESLFSSRGYIPVQGLKVGMEFNEINGLPICEKYLVPVRSGGGNGEVKKEKTPKLKEVLIPTQFRFHFDTAHLVKNLHKLDLNSEIVITDKWHGSSLILSHVRIVKKLTWLEKIAKKLGVQVVETKYAGIYSSGKPKSQLPKGIVGAYENTNASFYSKNIWSDAYEKYEHCLEPGISIYAELVGCGIQGQWDYGTTTEPRMVVYRITRTNDAGIVDEFSWNQLEEYCAKYELETVPVLYKGTVNDYIKSSYCYDDDYKDVLLQMMSDEYLEKKCTHCKNDVWAEGVVLRVEKPFEVFKLKSKNFILGESEAQEKEISNIEDEQ